MKKFLIGVLMLSFLGGIAASCTTKARPECKKNVKKIKKMRKQGRIAI